MPRLSFLRCEQSLLRSSRKIESPSPSRFFQEERKRLCSQGTCFPLVTVSLASLITYLTCSLCLNCCSCPFFWNVHGSERRSFFNSLIWLFDVSSICLDWLQFIIMIRDRLCSSNSACIVESISLVFLALATSWAYCYLLRCFHSSSVLTVAKVTQV